MGARFAETRLDDAPRPSKPAAAPTAGALITQGAGSVSQPLEEAATLRLTGVLKACNKYMEDASVPVLNELGDDGNHWRELYQLPKLPTGQATFTTPSTTPAPSPAPPDPAAAAGDNAPVLEPTQDGGEEDDAASVATDDAGAPTSGAVVTSRRILNFYGARDYQYIKTALEAFGQNTAQLQTVDPSMTKAMRNSVRTSNASRLVSAKTTTWRTKRERLTSAKLELEQKESIAKNQSAAAPATLTDWTEAIAKVQSLRTQVAELEREQFVAPGLLFTEANEVANAGTEMVAELRQKAGAALFAQCATSDDPNELVLAAAMSFDEMAHSRLLRYQRMVEKINEKEARLLKFFANAGEDAPETRILASLAFEKDIMRSMWARARAAIEWSESDKYAYARVRLALLAEALKPLLCTSIVTSAKDFVYQDLVVFWGDAVQVQKQYRNVALLGDSGTGKSTLGTQLGEIYGAAGFYLRMGDARKVEASEITPEFKGQVRAYVRNQLSAYLEGTIFIDEAYALNPKSDRSGGKSGGSEVLNEVVSFLSDNEGLAFFVAAGYEKQMREQFFAGNEGLQRRFTRRVFYPNASPVELTAVWRNSLTNVSLNVSARWSENCDKVLCYVLCRAKVTEYTSSMLRKQDPDDAWRSGGWHPSMQALFQRQFASMRTIMETCVQRLAVQPYGGAAQYGSQDMIDVLASVAYDYVESKQEQLTLKSQLDTSDTDLGRTMPNSLRRLLGEAKRAVDAMDSSLLVNDIVAALKTEKEKCASVQKLQPRVLPPPVAGQTR
ncbi:MAG: hypothetical protein CL822_00995, partial [Crocinitomicaceae bacterium]|nr:hypothetical protein [Crocinitomicaceae bacterium]